MSTFTIYTSLSEYDNKYSTGSLYKHYEMSGWLISNGSKNQVYELFRGSNVHSIWMWKETTGRWGRKATPSKKETVRDKTEKETVTRNSRKVVRQSVAKNNNTIDRRRL